MNKSYFDLEPGDQRTLLRIAEDKLGLSDNMRDLKFIYTTTSSGFCFF
jgi:hypothetical protein